MPQERGVCLKFNYVRFPGGKAKAFTLSYDDGVIQDRLLIERMEACGIRGTFNLNSGQYPPPGTVPEPGQWHIRLSRDEATQLYQRPGIEVAVHGRMHAHIGELSQALITRELLQDREALESQFGVIVNGACYPYSCWNEKIRLASQACGIEFARGGICSGGFSLPEDWLQWAPTCHHTDPDLPGLTQRFLDGKPERDPMLFFVWGHAYEFDRDHSWDVIETLLQAVCRRPDVWYATNGEIYAYLSACEQLRYSCDGSLVYNPTCVPVYLRVDYRDVVIQPGERLRLPHVDL